MATRLPASRRAVYEVLADPSTYPSWLVGAQRIRRVDPAFPAPDARFEHSVGPTPAATVDDDTAVIDNEPQRRLGLDVHVGPLHGTVGFELLDDPDGPGEGTLLVFRERPTGAAAALTPLLRPVLYWRNATSLRRLRRVLTGRGPEAAAGSAAGIRG